MERLIDSQFARPGARRSGHLQVVEGEPEASRPGDSLIPVGVALGAAALAMVAWISTSFPAPLARIPAAERPAVVEHTLANLRSVCRAADRPRDFCLAQARLLAGRPECDEACQAAVREELQGDTAVR